MRLLLRWFFRNRRTGAVTIIQAPNLLLWIAIASGILRLMVTDAEYGGIFTIVFRCALLAWAADEIVRGVNPWRRCLGVAVAVYQLAVLVW